MAKGVKAKPKVPAGYWVGRFPTEISTHLMHGSVKTSACGLYLTHVMLPVKADVRCVRCIERSTPKNRKKAGSK